jgi:glutamine amidotransferase
MITIIDYKMGNLGSIMNMFKRIGVQAEITADLDKIAKAEKLLLPGVGNFSRCAEHIAEMNLAPVLRESVLKRGVPMLGICMGMQLLGTDSEEGSGAGLGFIEARSTKFRLSPDANGKTAKVPHMGWSYVAGAKQHPLLTGLENPRFYFVHSYWVNCESREDVLLESEYGGCRFNAGVARDNFAGVQFHPEKSHLFGSKLLSNFAAWRP